MLSLADGLFGLGILVGLVLCWLGVSSYRRWSELGVGPFAAFAVTLGVTAAGSAVVGLFGLTFGPDDDFPLWIQLAMIGWAVSAVPWILFALQYTGRSLRIRLRTVGLLLLPFVGLGIGIVLAVTETGSPALSNLFSSAVLIYCLGLVLVGIYLLVRTTRTYGPFSPRIGTSLSIAPIATFLGLNSTGIVLEGSEAMAAGLYIGGFVTATAALVVAIGPYRTFDVAPAVGTLGERAAVHESDDLVFVVDDRDRVVTLNETALSTLDVSRPDALAGDVSALLGYDTTTLADRETVTLDTSAGSRRYDPQVSTLSDPSECELGALVSLRDVTDRERREQRLSVLNRVLRHNLRNKVDVLKSHTEALSVERTDAHTRALAETADDIAALGRNARRIDRFVAEAPEETRVDVAVAARETLETVHGDSANPTVSVDAPEPVPVVTNRRALIAALESALENAVEYADTTVRITVTADEGGALVSIVDDGPGIPEGELASLDSTVETPLQHGTGLGLWQLKWAVTTLGGDLSFETDDGTTVRFTIPDRAEETPATDR